MTLPQCCILIQKDVTWYACFWVCLPCNLILTFSYCHILYYPRATCYVRAHTSDVYHTLSTLCRNNLPFVAKKVLMVGVHDAASCLHCTSEFPLCPPTFIFVQRCGLLHFSLSESLGRVCSAPESMYLLLSEATHTVWPPDWMF